MTKQEVVEQLRQLDEVTLLEILEVTSEELVDVFLDKIDDKLEYLQQQLSIDD